jgi:hypothetical protein
MPEAEISTELGDPTVPLEARKSAGERAGPRPGTRSHLRWPHLDAPARREIILALALLFCYGFFRQVPVWNEYSRYDLVRALAEDGTTSIDLYQENTGDKAFYNGHYYSDKAPGTAFLGLPVYLLLALASEAAGAGTPDPETAVHALAFGVSGIATVLLVLLLLRFLRPIVGEGWALVVGVGYGLGSLAFPFGTMFFGHAASAFFLFASFYLLGRWRADARVWRPILAGFLAGWAVLVDISMLLGVLVLLVYAMSVGRSNGRREARDALRGPLLMVAGAAAPAALLAWYNEVSFGGPFSLGYGSLSNPGFAEAMSRGILGVTWPSGEVLVELLGGPRGLLRLAPWFLLVPAGVLAATRRDLRLEVLVCGAIVVAFLAFNAGYYLPLGGWTPGPRFLLPALPFAAVLVALAPAALRVLAACLIAVSVAIFLVSTSTMPNAPELYRDPLYELWLPRLLNRDIADTIAWSRWGLHGIQPLLVLGVGLAVAATALLATFRSGAAARRLSGALAASQVLLTVAFALPVAPPRAINLALAGPSAQPAGLIAIVEAGATLVVTGDRETAVIWAQLENRGPALDDTRVVFEVFAPDASPTWSAWYDDVGWQEGSRRRMTTEWDTKRVQAGEYRVRVSVVSDDHRTVYSSVDDAAVIRVHS